MLYLKFVVEFSFLRFGLWSIFYDIRKKNLKAAFYVIHLFGCGKSFSVQRDYSRCPLYGWLRTENSFRKGGYHFSSTSRSIHSPSLVFILQGTEQRKANL